MPFCDVLAGEQEITEVMTTPTHTKSVPTQKLVSSLPAAVTLAPTLQKENESSASASVTGLLPVAGIM